MNKVLEIKDGQVIEGFDQFDAIDWCTPSVLGCKACISANTSGNSVTLTITLKTPFGSYTKSFSFSKDLCFTFQPIPKVGIEICIADFDASAKQVCFTLSGRVCINVPFIGKKCTPKFSHEFCIPLPGHNLHELLESKSLDDSQLATMLLLSYNLDATDSRECNCH